MAVTMGYHRTMAASIIKDRYKRPYKHHHRLPSSVVFLSNRIPLSVGQKHSLTSKISARSASPTRSSSLLKEVAAGQPPPPPPPPPPSSPARIKLENLLSRPIEFVPATSLTSLSEMAELRKRKPAKAGSAEHRARSSTVSSDHKPPSETFDSLLQASRVSKKWSVGASGKRSQGLYNPHSYCYRRTALQALLHMPEFLNWLDGHAHPPTSTAPSAKAQPTNDQTRGISFSKHAPPQASVPPSSEAQTNKTQPTNSKPGEAAPSTQESSEAQANADGGEATSGSEKEAKVHGKCVGKDCLACGLRELCQAYWNSAPKRGEGDRELSRGQVSKFDKLVNRIGPKVNDPFPNWETVAVDVNADAPEFLMWMLSKMSAQGTLP